MISRFTGTLWPVLPGNFGGNTLTKGCKDSKSQDIKGQTGLYKCNKIHRESAQQLKISKVSSAVKRGTVE
jgi:hypothetical protein